MGVKDHQNKTQDPSDCENDNPNPPSNESQKFEMPPVNLKECWFFFDCYMYLDGENVFSKPGCTKLYDFNILGYEKSIHKVQAAAAKANIDFKMDTIPLLLLE